jgi:membrane protease YdiL (CAAX protease family)
MYQRLKMSIDSDNLGNTEVLQQQMPRTTNPQNNRIILIPVCIIIIAEILLYLKQPYYSILLHVMTVIGLALSTSSLKSNTVKKAFQALMLLPILRLLNMSMPVFYDIMLYSLVFIYAPMFISLYLIIKHQMFTKKQLGIRFKMFGLYAILGLVLGIALAEGEYRIITTEYMIPDLSIVNIIGLSIVMIFFVALIEELIFRSILQTRLEESFGMLPGLIVTSILFGIMHSGYGNPYEILLTAGVGLLLGYLFQRTRNLPFIVMTHGFTNIFLFGIIPHLGPGLGFF